MAIRLQAVKSANITSNRGERGERSADFFLEALIKCRGRGVPLCTLWFALFADT
jgi:hypothetical protein